MLMNYMERCQAPLTGLGRMGWANGGMFGLGATAAQRRATATARRTAATQKRAARRLMKVQGRPVATSNPAATQALENSMNALRSASARAVALGQQALRSNNKAVKQQALAQIQSALKQVAVANAPAHPATVNRLRGLFGLGALGSCVDDGTGTGNMIDNGDGLGCPQAGVAPTDTSGGTPTSYPTTYGTAPVGYGTTSPYGLSPTMGDGLAPGFGGSLMPQMSAPVGCATGSNLPRCLIFAMAEQEQQQYQFVFSILQQMYAQLLQIVQQLMAQLQSQQQQPGYPYSGYGPTPYSPYGQSPYGSPYGASPYGGYGDPSMYGGYGMPGSQYGYDTGTIPAGYGDGSGQDDAAMVAASGTDASQLYAGPSLISPTPPGPPTGLISSDGPLPDGSGGDNSDGYGSTAQAPVPAFQQVANPVPAPQAVNAGPGQPNIVIQLQTPGQSAYADANIPADQTQNQPTLEPPQGTEEGWAQDEGLS